MSGANYNFPFSGYVLVERVASKRQGRTLWFKQMTAIGPMTTADPRERMLFPTEDAARQSPAMYHSLSCYEVEDWNVEGIVGVDW